MNPNFDSFRFVINELNKLNKIEESDIELMNIIGQGAFGEVFKGKLKLDKTEELTVAIKVLVMCWVNQLDLIFYLFFLDLRNFEIKPKDMKNSILLKRLYRLIRSTTRI